MRGAVEPQGVTCYDFGTAFSKVAVCRSGFVSKPLPIGTVGGSERPFGVPSLVFHDSGSVYLGAPALARLTGAPDQRREALSSFKMILSASDLDLVLETRPSLRIEPAQSWTYADFIVVYLAYLIHLTEYALRKADLGPVSDQEIRVVLPDWSDKAGDKKAQLLARLFSRAFTLEAILGNKLLSGIVARPQVDEALEKTAGPLKSEKIGIVFEPAAAAFAFMPEIIASRAKVAVVIDVGAGTTDFAGCMIQRGRSVTLRFLRDTYRTINVAGDSFDTALLNMIIDDERLQLDFASRDAVWRACSRDIRSMSSQLFAAGSLDVCVLSQRLAFGIEALAQRHDLIQSVEAISDQLEAVIALLRKRHAVKASTIVLIVTGGGSNSFTLLNDRVKRTGRKKFHSRYKVLSHKEDTGSFFSRADLIQVATAMGGAAADPRLIHVVGQKATL